jgi:hypothetical protein
MAKKGKGDRRLWKSTRNHVDVQQRSLWLPECFVDTSPSLFVKTPIKLASPTEVNLLIAVALKPV